MIAIVSYGSGNVQAIANIYNRIGVPFLVATGPEDLERADRFLLPGVGAFDQCMTALNESGMRSALDRLVRGEGRPALGICVGMQLLANASEEGKEKGLGWIEGTVRRFDVSRMHQATRLPHMGWNTIEPVGDAALFEGVDLTTGYYFLHSYYFECAREADVRGLTEYGGRFASAVGSGSVHGVQFHPEKSHQAGIRLLQNFASL